MSAPGKLVPHADVSEMHDQKSAKVLAESDRAKRVEEALRFLVAHEPSAGQAFFRLLARHLASCLNMDYVCIDRLEPGLLSAQTVAVYFDGEFEDDLTHTLADTPCGAVVENKVCCFADNVRRQFPKDAVLQAVAAEGFAGTLLRDSRGQPIGLIGTISRRPVPDPELATSILQLVGVRAAAELERQRTAEVMAADLDVMTRLQQLGASLVRNGDLTPILAEIVDAAIAIAGADFGSIQLLDRQAGALRIAARRGFPDSWAEFWNNMAEGRGSCVTALERGERIVVEDIEQSALFAGTPALDVQRRAGVRALQSTPLLSRSGQLLGVVSTHHRTTHRPDERELRLLDLLARQAADTIARTQAEEALRESEARLRSLTENVPSVLMRCDRQLRVVYLSQQAEAITGVPVAQLLGKTNRELGMPEALCGLWEDAIAAVFRTGETRELEFDVPSPLGPRSFFLRLAAEKTADGSFEHVLGVATEVTGRKRAEANQALLTEVLQILNRGGGLGSVIRDALRAIQRATGFEAVGLRVRRGDDYPYFEQNGFTGEFLEQENWLCAVDRTGAVVRDSRGRVMLECTCGLVLSGRTPQMSCFTASGSFWTNRSEDLLALPLEDDPRTNPRNRCIHAGYRSVGLFPVGSGEEILGLLQLNDRREGRFTPELLAFLESLAQNIGLALRRSTAEAALRASEERFRGLVEQAVDGIFVADSQGRYIDVNAPGAAMLGYTPAEICRLTLLDVLAPQELDRIPDQMTQLAGGAVVRNEWQFRRKDGSTFTGELVGRQLADGGLQGILRDVTERRLAEAALRESEEQFRALAQSLVSAVALVNQRGEFSIVNRSFLRMFDLNEQADLSTVNSQDWSKWRFFDENGALLAVDDHPVRKATLTRTAVNDALVAVESPAGTGLKWLLVSAEPILDHQGNLHRVVCTYHDITARKHAEEALQEANAALAEADRRKNEFIAILSHELRNPLAPIRYALPVLGAQALDEAGGRALAVVGRQVDHLVRLVDDLLDVSRITSGKIELRREHVTLASVVAAAAEAAAPAITGGRHTLRMDVPDGPAWLYADPARIAQVVNNLLDNSAKYTPKGGEILLQAERDASGVVIRVRDNGMGIPADALPGVFEMFRQAGHAGRSQGGLGIGLALVKLLVEMHGGTIEARSAGVGQGAEFVVRLPVPENIAVQREGVTPLPAGGRRLRVLVVDDNADLVEMLGVAVESAGHEVRKALDGPSGVSAALSYRPDIVLLDVGLPGMSGIEVARELRRRPEMAGAWLVALTGWGQAEHRRQTRDAGFDHHLTKPTEPETLRRLLAEIASQGPSPRNRTSGERADE